jgi:23S rRNA (cytosine1962-C5)-methyltransferase
LLQKCRQLLSEDALFMVLTIYAIRASSLAAHYALADLFDNQGGCLESGELAIQEAPLKSGKTDLSRYVAQANFARWCSDIAA